MDFPIFEMPFVGTRWLIGLVAILHVLVNHGAAVGGSLVAVMLERRGHRLQDSRWEDLAYRLARVYFIATTSVGALSGVGIWFTTMVANPTAIGTMLRIYFWGWFTEWIVFVIEVVMVLAYFLSWHHFRQKTTHIKLGYWYAGMSFATMAIITAILAGMLSPGQWLHTHSFWHGFFNPTYVPQLLLRMGLALGLAAAGAMALTRWLAPADFQVEAQRYMAKFLLAAAPFMAVGGLWYLIVLPDSVRGLIPTALVTTRFANYVSASYLTNIVLVGLAAGVAVWAIKRQRPLPLMALGVPLLVLTMLLGQFERVREFIRKPYLIHGYLYANGIRVDQVAGLNRDGVLPHARFAAVKTVTPANRLVAGREVFKLECASCHTIGGLNDMRAKTAGHDEAALSQFIGVQHQVHPFMPPFVGTQAERDALAAYLASLSAEAPSPSPQPGKPAPVSGQQKQVPAHGR